MRLSFITTKLSLYFSVYPHSLHVFSRHTALIHGNTRLRPVPRLFFFFLKDGTADDGGGLVKWMDSDFFRTLQENFSPGTGGLVTFCRHSSSCRIQFRCISHSWCAGEAGGWAGSDWKAVWVYVASSCVPTYSSILPWAAESETLAPQWAIVHDRSASFSVATTTPLFTSPNL